MPVGEGLSPPLDHREHFPGILRVPNQTGLFLRIESTLGNFLYGSRLVLTQRTAVKFP
jgi:hypothetical protein